MPGPKGEGCTQQTPDTKPRHVSRDSHSIGSDDTHVLPSNATGFRTVFDHVPLGVALVDSRTGVLQMVNRRCAEILGATPTDLIGRTWMELTDPVDIPVEQERIDLLCDGSIREFSLEKRTIRADGAMQWIQVDVSATWDVGSAPTAHVVTIADITELKATQTNLAQHQRLLQIVFDASPAMILVKDADSRILFANPVFADFYGRTVEQVTGQLQSDLHAGRGGDALELGHWLSDDRRVLDSEFPLFRSETGTNHDGLRRVYHTAKYPIEISPGKNAVLVITQDVTEQHESTQVIEEQSRISEMIARGDTLQDVLLRITALIESQSPDLMTSVLLVDEDGKRLRHGVAPRLPDEYNDLIDGICVGEGVGSCGTAVHRKEPVYVADTLEDRLWKDFVNPARQFALRSCWSIPLLDSSGTVLGTFAIYRKVPGFPSARHKFLLDTASQLTRIALIRDRDVSAIQQKELFVRNVLDSLASAVVVLNADGRIVEANVAWSQFVTESDETADRNAFIGTDYVQMFRQEIVSESEDADRITTGLASIIAGQSEMFDTEFSCHSPSRQRWFLMRAHPLRGSLRGLVISHTDITSRRHAEERLKREYSFRESIIASAADGICVCQETASDQGIHFSVWNNAMTRITGYTVEEINRLGWYQTLYVTAAEQQRAADRMARMRSGDDLESEEWEIRHKDGLPRSVMISTRVITENSNVPRVLAVIHDLTGRKEAERTLREAQLFADTLLNSMNGLVLSFTSDGQMVRWNRALEEVSGYEPDEILQMVPAQFVISEERARVQQQIEEAFATGASADEFTAVTKSGRCFPCYLSARTVTINGQPLLVAVGFDLTERRNAEAQIRRLAAFPELNPSPVLEFDANGQVTYSNQAARALALSMSSHDLSSLQPASAPVTQCLSTGKPVTGIESRHSGRTLSWTYHPIMRQNIVHCYVTDVTERIALESQYRQATKMESVGQLAGGVAHDFNNLLAALFMQVELSLQVPQLPGAVHESLLDIQATAQRAADLTRQLLLFSRQEAIRPRDLNLCETIDRTTRMLQLILRGHIRLHLDLESVTHSIHADPGMLDQVLLNLAVNARDAMPDGGMLVIQTFERELSAEELHAQPQANPGTFVGLRVTDDGEGIPPELVPRIFEPFFTTKDVGKGTGLGLATVFGIVQQHGGLINVDSVVGQGTTFEILLPAGGPLSQDTEAAAESQPLQHGTETILLVEDEQAVRRMVRTVLGRYGYRVLEAENGMQALESWAEHGEHVAMLITDLVMPDGISGQQLAQQLSIGNPELKIIFTSGYSVEASASDLELSSTRRYIPKPFHVQTLLDTVRETLESKV
jgi:two-component system, cell cycle sensor histidine kinase and response regulator CckA